MNPPNPKKLHATKAKRFVSVLRMLAKIADLSPGSLAAAAGVKDRTLRSWLSGDVLPSEERMTAARASLAAQATAARKIADALDVTLSSI